MSQKKAKPATRPGSRLITCCYCQRPNQPYGGVLHMGNDPFKLKVTPPICAHCMHDSILPRLAERQQDPTKHTEILMEAEDKN